MLVTSKSGRISFFLSAERVSFNTYTYCKLSTSFALFSRPRTSHVGTSRADTGQEMPLHISEEGIAEAFLLLVM